MQIRRTQPARIQAQTAPDAAGAFVAATLGAVVGAVAIGRLFGRRRPLREVRRRRVSIDDRTVARLRVGEFIRDDVPPPPIR